MKEKLPSYKQRFSELTIAKMRQELADEALESKWQELNMGIDQWKHKYLYPFGNIAPITEKDRTPETSTIATTQDTSRMRQDNSIFSTNNGQNRSQFSPPAYNDPHRPQDSIFQSEESKFLSPHLQ